MAHFARQVIEKAIKKLRKRKGMLFLYFRIYVNSTFYTTKYLPLFFRDTYAKQGGGGGELGGEGKYPLFWPI